jgi:hypothetical protein
METLKTIFSSGSKGSRGKVVETRYRWEIWSILNNISLIVTAFLGNETLVEPSPLTVELNGTGYAEEKHLLHGPGSPMGQMNAVQ